MTSRQIGAAKNRRLSKRIDVKSRIHSGNSLLLQRSCTETMKNKKSTKRENFLSSEWPRTDGICKEGIKLTFQGTEQTTEITVSALG